VAPRSSFSSKGELPAHAQGHTINTQSKASQGRWWGRGRFGMG